MDSKESSLTCVVVCFLLLVETSNRSSECNYPSKVIINRFFLVRDLCVVETDKDLMPNGYP